jgi:hypothetical protein
MAKASRMKPIYAAVVQVSELNAAHIESTAQNSPAAAPLANELTKARSVVDLLLEHSDVPPNSSYNDLMMQAHESYRILETNGGSSCEDVCDCLHSPNQLSTASPGAFDPGSSCVSSRADSVRRLSFTPTANLECSPANCSPISRFCFEPSDSTTPSAMSRHLVLDAVVLQGGGGSSTTASTAAVARSLLREGSSPLMSSMQVSPAAAETPRRSPVAADTPNAAAVARGTVNSPLARDSYCHAHHYHAPNTATNAPGGVVTSSLPPPWIPHLRVRTRVARRDQQ